MKERERKGLRFSTVDAVIVALMLAVLVGAVAIFNRNRQDRANVIEIEYRLLLSDMQIYEGLVNPWENWRAGDAVYNQNGTAVLGAVECVELLAHREPTVQNGRIVLEAVPDRADVIVSVKALAKERTGDGLRVRDIRIAAGGVGDFQIHSCRLAGAQILSVREVVTP